MMQLGKHYKITPRLLNQASVVSLVNRAAPAQAMQLNGAWQPRRILSSYIAQPAEEILQNALIFPISKTHNTRRGHPHAIKKKKNMKGVHKSGAYHRSKSSMPGATHPPRPQSDRAADQAKNSNRELLEAPCFIRASFGMQTDTQLAQLICNARDRGYGNIFGCISLQHAYWEHFIDLYGVPADSNPMEHWELGHACSQVFGEPVKPDDRFLVIDQLAVAPPLRHLGIGTALMQHAIAQEVQQNPDLAFSVCLLLHNRRLPRG